MSSKTRKWHIKYEIKSRPNIYFITRNENCPFKYKEYNIGLQRKKIGL